LKHPEKGRVGRRGGMERERGERNGREEEGRQGGNKKERNEGERKGRKGR